MNKYCLIFNYTKTNSTPLNILLASLLQVFKKTNLKIVLSLRKDNLSEQIKTNIESGRKIIVLWSFFSTQFNETKDQLSIIKGLFSNIDILHIAGGSHATTSPEHTLKAGFDLIALGEGEIIIRKLIYNWIHNKDIHITNGIAFYDKGLLVINTPPKEIELDNFPPFCPEYLMFNPIEITRGCIYGCKFCQTSAMFKNKFRHRSIEHICHYVKIENNYKTPEIRFFTPSALSYGSSDNKVYPDIIENLLYSVRKIIGSKGKLFFGSFPSEIRPEHIDITILKILKKYVDNDNLITGAQSGSSRILNACHRNHHVTSVIDAAKACKEVGFKLNVDFMFGLPKETGEDIKASFDLIDKLIALNAKIHAHIFMPLPGTPFKSFPAPILDSNTEQKLKSLSASGKLYGQWRNQKILSKKLN